MLNALVAEQMLTPSQTLAEVLLAQPLSDYVIEKRHAIPQWSWRLIAERLESDTDGKVSVSGETLRTWYADAAERADLAS